MFRLALFPRDPVCGRSSARTILALGVEVVASVLSSRSAVQAGIYRNQILFNRLRVRNHFLNREALWHRIVANLSHLSSLLFRDWPDLGLLIFGECEDLRQMLQFLAELRVAWCIAHCQK